MEHNTKELLPPPLDDYTFQDNVTGKPGAVDLDAYIADAMRTESPVSPIVTDQQALLAALAVLRKAGLFADQIRKLVIYKSEKIDVDTLTKAIDEIHDACDVFDTALFREVSEEYEGEEVPVNHRLLHAALGSFGEQSEKLELLSQQVTTGLLDLKKFLLENGDGQWFGAIEMDELRRLTGFTPGAIMTANIAKLRERVPEKFTTEGFLNRNENAEEAAAFGKVA